jgi:hypothetical protein
MKVLSVWVTSVNCALSQLVFLISSKLFLFSAYIDIKSQFNLLFGERNSRIMEDFKQIMANVDSYMSMLIESHDFPHPEGQFKFFRSLLWKTKRFCQGQYGINNQKHFHELHICVYANWDLPFIVSLNLHDNDSSLVASV